MVLRVEDEVKPLSRINPPWRIGNQNSEIRIRNAAILLASIFFFLASATLAQFEFTPNCQQAQVDILDLRINTARQILAKEKQHHPENGYILYLEHFADIVEIIAVDDERLYEKLMDTYVGRLEQMDRLDKGSPYNDILQAEMLFYTGLAQLKFGTQLNGAAKIYGSYRKVRAHVERYPEFTFNRKMAGMYNIMMDFIPKSVRWIAGILGVRGDARKGMGELKEYFEHVKKTPGLAQEAVLIINLAHKLTWQDKEGLEFMSRQNPSITDNTLASYVWAMSAAYYFRNDLAVEKLMSIDREKLEVPFYALDYVTGRCLLNKLDENAHLYLERYLEEYPGEDFKKDACNRLSYHYLLQGDMKLFRKYKKNVSRVGQELRERDLEAVKESYFHFPPHRELLKARLLFDGGYFHLADSVLQAIPVSSLNLLPYKIENSYRRGRVCQMLGRTGQALTALEEAYQRGKNEPYTFATRAAMQLGMIYEQQQDYANALRWYNNCLECFDDDHTASSVEDKARKGRKRVVR